MPRLANHPAELIDLVAHAQRFRANQQANGDARGKSGMMFLNDRDGRFVGIRHAKKNFEFGIVLAAETCVIFVGFAVQPADRFQNAERRAEIGGS